MGKSWPIHFALLISLAVLLCFSGALAAGAPSPDPAVVLMPDMLAWVWFHADADGNFPEGDANTLLFDPDTGTGKMWVTVGDGGADALTFTYTLAEDGVLSLTQTGSLEGTVLPAAWACVNTRVTYGDPYTLLTCSLADGTEVARYYRQPVCGL